MSNIIDVISTTAQFASLEDEWNHLAASFGNPLLRHEFYAASVATYAAPDQLAVFVVRKNGALHAIAPLHVARYFGVRRLEPLPRRLGEPGGFLYSNRESLELLINALAKQGLPMILGRLNAGSVEAELLQRSLDGRAFGRLADTGAFVRVTDGGDVAWVPLDGDARRLEERMSAGRRSDLRRYRRRAERFGEVEFAMLAPGEDNVDLHLGEVFRLENSGWKQRARTAILSDPHFGRFYTTYGRLAARLGMLRLFFLRIGGRTVAARMAVEYVNRLWDLRIGYDETFRECSPGILLTHETLRYASDKGLKAHEFLGRGESWEEIWKCEYRQSKTFRVYPISLSGIACFGLECGRLAKRRFTRSFPATMPS